jgi:uncharacterized protein YjbJ (UPF0337 family)
MNWDQIIGKWKKIKKQIKGKVRLKWGKLTDNDINLSAGKKDELVVRIQERYGLAKEQAEKELNAFIDSLMQGSDRPCHA